ncbi:hypothetical protein ACXZ9C_11160 [Streptococcus agalactiae]
MASRRRRVAWRRSWRWRRRRVACVAWRRRVASSRGVVVVASRGVASASRARRVVASACVAWRRRGVAWRRVAWRRCVASSWSSRRRVVVVVACRGRVVASVGRWSRS